MPQPGEMEMHAADLTATISGTVPFKEVQRRLAEIVQWLPVDGDAEKSVGELVAENSTGPLRLGFGGWRDLLLGCEVGLNSGERIRVGGRTMKNVAGYDVTKLMVGQGGMLGEIEAITVRTYKRPAAALGVRVEKPEGLLAGWMGTGARPSWAVLSAEGLECGWLGDAGELEYWGRELKEFGVKKKSVEEDILRRSEIWPAGEGRRFRAAVPPSRILEFAGACSDWRACAAFGIVIGGCENGEKILEAARGVGGTAVIFEDGVRRWEMGEVEKMLLGRVREAFGNTHGGAVGLDGRRGE